MRQAEMYFFFQNIALYILLGLGAIIVFCIFVVWIIEKIKRVITKLRKYRGDGMTEIELTLNSPITEEQLDAIFDVDFDHTNRIWFHTKHGKTVEFIKVEPPTTAAAPPATNADRIRAMSDEELAEWLGDMIFPQCLACPATDEPWCLDRDCFTVMLAWLRASAEEGADNDPT